MSHLPEREVDTGAPEQQSPHNRTGIAQEKIPMRHTAPRPPSPMVQVTGPRPQNCREISSRELFFQVPTLYYGKPGISRL